MQILMSAISAHLVSSEMYKDETFYTKDQVIHVLSKDLTEFDSSLAQVLSNCEHHILHLKNNSQLSEALPLSDEVSFFYDDFTTCKIKPS